ncbi:hypothetical protein BKA65DRAFT_574667 [Rhexocercosporidium sp. MPI-PUGE-AT-0058]|nr:hypothetical protein BKA65DRAFT_574667 [Rhexocercosporidium sp. MPI-PUGE-AT-0058]
MLLYNMFFQSLLVLLWTFTTPTDGQGGSFGFTQAALNDGFCAVTSNTRSNFVGCYNIGPVNASNAKTITQDSTTVTFGTGTFYTPFILTNTGTGATSYTGYVVRPASEWTSSETSLNCTVACRSHGMKYAMMTLGVCGCSPFLSTNGASVYITSKSGNPPDIQYPDGASPCGGGGVVPSRPNCFGDAAQLGCGGLTGSVNTGSWNKRYGTGLLANAIWFDNSFAKDSDIIPSVEAGAYLYLACFKIPSTGYQMFQPEGFVNTFTNFLDCNLFCAKLNMPYAARAWDSTTSKVKCKCGTEFNTNIFQTDDVSNCNVNCVTGTTTGCGVLSDCCGSALNFAVYRNDGLLGCYEPPIPGSSLAGSGTYPVQCGPTTAIYFSRTSVVGTTTLSNNPLATARASPGLSYVGGFYNWLGCYPANYLTSVIATLNIPNGSGLAECMVFCSTASGGGPATWVSVAAFTSGLPKLIYVVTRRHFYYCLYHYLYNVDDIDDHHAAHYNDQFYKLYELINFFHFEYLLIVLININFYLKQLLIVVHIIVILE